MPTAPLLALYSQVTSCANPLSRCSGILRDIPAGVPPRGFYTEAAPGTVKLLLVGKNPGHVIEGETALYANRTAEEIVSAHFAWARRCFYDQDSFDRDSRRSLTFHKNILRYVGHFLDVPHADVFRYCAYTNIVKCQTVGEQDALHRGTIGECFSRHFLEEIRVLRPRVLLALGREAFAFLISRQRQHGLHVLYVKHPSYHYRKELLRPTLDDLKRRIHELLRTDHSC